MIIVIFLLGASHMGIGSAEEPFEFLECPTISDGHYPFCECKHAPKYDDLTNTCPNPECPPNDSTGVYPNCTCLRRNFDYSIYLNECFRVCPENSSGYWPQCNCESDGYVFDKSLFECRTCPILSSTGQYPNCSCAEDAAIYNNLDNSCEKCEHGSFGVYPDCTCSEGAFYDFNNRRCVQFSNDELASAICKNYRDRKSAGDSGSANENYGVMNTDCLECLVRSSGIYPDCVCEGNGTYDALNNICNECAFRSVGIYPNCVCDGNGTYNESTNFCNECPLSSVGVYPNCICGDNGTYFKDENWYHACPTESTGEYPNYFCELPSQYVIEKNLCLSCPVNGSGIYPNCQCKNGFFSKTYNSCIECPINSTGLYPDCKCNDEDVLFSAFINQCSITCPDNASGIHPDCQCYADRFYEASEFICKSNIGRQCPLDSIGIGPDCLCMRKNNQFNSFFWNCMETGTTSAAGAPAFGGSSNYCPDNSGKWPRCEASIDRNTLISLIG